MHLFRTKLGRSDLPKHLRSCSRPHLMLQKSFNSNCYQFISSIEYTSRMNNDFLDALSIDELWEKYAAVHNRLKDLGQIRSRNITGDFGEQLAISMYNKTKGLPKLQMAPPSTKNI